MKVCLLAVLAMMLISCDLFFPMAQEWTISGSISVENVQLTNPFNNLKMAALLNHNSDPFGREVSNVVALQNHAIINFVLQINVSEYPYDKFDKIYIKVWEDEDLDNNHDIGEFLFYVDSMSSCPVFGGETPYFIYIDGFNLDNYWGTGWHANGYYNKTVNKTDLTNARFSFHY